MSEAQLSDRQRPVAEPTHEVLDAEIIGRLESLGEAIGEDFLGELAALFLADAERQIAELRQALADADGDSVARLAHSLKGSSANLGASHLASVCASVETAGGADHLLVCGLLIDAMEAELGRVRAALGAQIRTS